MKKQILILVMALLSAATFAQTAKYKEAKGKDDKVAIKGYDPVAYFTESKAVIGKKSIASIKGDKTYYFSSEKNKALFLKNPTAYEPQYGGYCAYGISENHKAPIQPEQFSIVDNKLYLNYNSEVKGMWLKDQKKLIKTADANWMKIEKK